MTKNIRQRTTMVCYRIWKNVGQKQVFHSTVIHRIMIFKLFMYKQHPNSSKRYKHTKKLHINFSTLIKVGITEWSKVGISGINYLHKKTAGNCLKKPKGRQMQYCSNKRGKCMYIPVQTCLHLYQYIQAW